MTTILEHLRARPRSGGPVGLALVLAACGLLAASASAGGGTLKLTAVANKAAGKTIVVNPAGRTLYALTPETTRHLLCKSRECLKFWPPLTVPSRSTKLSQASGVHGKLGLLRRSNGTFQVTLRGMPLYRFAEDHAAREVNGEGIKSFGGVWHAVSAAVESAPAPAPSEPTSEPYGY